MDSEVKEAIVRLREQRPNMQNRGDLLDKMKITLSARTDWIRRESPTMTQILGQYPRFHDMPEAVSAIFIFLIAASPFSIFVFCKCLLSSKFTKSPVKSNFAASLYILKTFFLFYN